MPNESFRSPKPEVSRQLAMLHAAAAGRLDRLDCPCCKAPAVSVWFTHSGGDYFTWFTCGQCGYETRAQGTRPDFYVEQRDRTSRKPAEDQPLVGANHPGVQL